MSLLPEISQASAEINKLVAQANIHQTIAPVDPAAFTDPADTALLASRDPVIREVSVGMTGEAYSDYSVSGTPPLSLPNSLGKPLKAWAVEVSPYQEGSGDPSPDNVRPIHGTNQISFVTAGKNLLNIEESTIVSAEWNRIIPINLVAGTYTMSCQNQLIIGGTTRGAQIAIVRSFAGNVGSIIRRIVNGYSYGNTILDFTFTLTASESAEMVGIMFEPTATGLTYAELSDMQNMIELGSTASAYVPYSGNNTYTIEIPTEAGTVYGGELTVNKDGSGTVESGDTVYVFDENLAWSTWGVNNQVQGITGFYFYRSGTPTIDFTNINVAVSTNWLPINNRVWGGGAVGYYTNNTNVNPASWYEMVGIENSVAGITDTDTAQQAIDKFKAFLAINPLQVRFSLVTPVTYTLTAPPIPTPTGTATTWATAEHGTVESMEVTYVGKA